MNDLPGCRALTETQRALYDRGRAERDRSTLCHAPSKGMRMNPGGKVLPCSQNTIFEIGTWPGQSLREIWEGERRKDLLGRLARYCTAPGCQECMRDIENGRMEGVRSKLYDSFYPNRSYPALLDFKLESTCDLACVMCSSYSSTSHRRGKGRDVPGRRRIYDRRFVEEVSEFVPFLKEARFTGGEPFLIPIYRDIWKEIARLNPDCNVWIQTSGSRIDGKARGIIDGSRMSFNFSIDSLDRERYESIRPGSSFDVMRGNFEYLLGACRRRGTEITVNTCVMRQNHREIADIVNFCNRLDIPIGFCIVWFPAMHALWTLPPEEIGRIHGFYSGIELPDDTKARAENRRRFLELTSVIGSCMEAAIGRSRPVPASRMEMEAVLATIGRGCDAMGLAGREEEDLRAALARRLDELVPGDADGRRSFVAYMNAILCLFSPDILVDTLLNEPLSRLVEDIRAFGGR